MYISRESIEITPVGTSSWRIRTECLACVSPLFYSGSGSVSVHSLFISMAEGTFSMATLA